MNTDDYRAHIDRLIREMSGELVLNGSPSHATIIIERMFANARENVSVLSRRFDPRIYGSPETVDQAELFLGEQERTAHIVIEEETPSLMEDHPFFVRMRPALERGNLQVRLLPTKLVDLVKVNFATMDDVGFRFETDKTKAVATAAFGDSTFMQEITELFSEIWKVSIPIKLPTTA